MMPLVPADGAGDARINRPHPFGMGVRKALQKKRIDNGKDRGVCADGERQRENHRDSEAGVAP